MIKVLIFDFGGVLAGKHSEEAGLHGLCKKFSKICKISTRKIYKIYKKYWNDWKLGKITMNTFYDNLIKELNIKIDKKKMIHMTLNYASLDKNVYYLIKRLKKHYKVVCLTNHSREWFENEIRRFRLKSLFHRIFTSYNLKLAKPNPRVYKVVLKKLKVKPAQCLFIDDLERNTKPASKLGMHTIVFHSYSQLKKELVKLKIKV